MAYMESIEDIREAWDKLHTDSESHRQAYALEEVVRTHLQPAKERLVDEAMSAARHALDRLPTEQVVQTVSDSLMDDLSVLIDLLMETLALNEFGTWLEKLGVEEPGGAEIRKSFEHLHAEVEELVVSDTYVTQAAEERVERVCRGVVAVPEVRIWACVRAVAGLNTALMSSLIPSPRPKNQFTPC